VVCRGNFFLNRVKTMGRIRIHGFRLIDVLSSQHGHDEMLKQVDLKGLCDRTKDLSPYDVRRGDAPRSK
jgi:hypothetical protein